MLMLMLCVVTLQSAGSSFESAARWVIIITRLRDRLKQKWLGPSTTAALTKFLASRLFVLLEK